MQPDQAVLALGALAHATRLGAYRLLVQAGPAGLSVGELRARLDLAPATLSAHLNVLRAAGLVGDEREGRVIRLRADYARMDALLGYLTENCCAGASCTPPAECTPAASCAPTHAPATRTDPHAPPSRRRSRP